MATRQELLDQARTRAETLMVGGCRQDLREARRWAERARRLAPSDPNGLFLLAMVCLRLGEPDAEAHLAELSRDHDVREVWVGLATIRRLRGDLPGAAGAAARCLSGHALFAGIVTVAAGIGRGWCGLSGDGQVTVGGVTTAPAIWLDDRRIPFRGGTRQLPAGWQSARRLIARQGDTELLGSPIDIAAIRRLEGFVALTEDGLTGWAWHPSDPDRAPELTLLPAAVPVPALDTGIAVAGLLSRPRGFSVAALPKAGAPLRVVDRDGHDLPGSPLHAGLVPKTRVRAARSLAPAPARRDTAAARWRRAIPAGGSVLLITHADGGGVERHIRARHDHWRTAGKQAVVLRPISRDAGAGWCVLADQPELRFRLPDELPMLAALLRDAGTRQIEVHHLLGHHHAVLELPRLLDIPYDVFIHDYAWFCPRILLVGRDSRYCGEPDPVGCQSCVADLGHALEEDIGVAALRARSALDLAGARRVVAPSRDTAARLRRHFPGIRAEILPWDSVPAIAVRSVPRDGTTLVCVVGAIGVEKGFHVLLDCARDAAARQRPLSFVVVGHTIDDAALMDTGRVFVTGEYQESEAIALIRAQSATIGFVPSIWPETWCYALSHIWESGLHAVAFDIGAPAERIRAGGLGTLLPLNLPPARINHALLAYSQRASNETPTPRESTGCEVPTQEARVRHA